MGSSVCKVNEEFLIAPEFDSSERLTESQRSDISYTLNTFDQTLNNPEYYCWSWAQSIFPIARAGIKLGHVAVIKIEVT